MPARKGERWGLLIQGKCVVLCKSGRNTGLAVYIRISVIRTLPPPLHTKHDEILISMIFPHNVTVLIIQMMIVG